MAEYTACRDKHVEGEAKERSLEPQALLRIIYERRGSGSQGAAHFTHSSTSSISNISNIATLSEANVDLYGRKRRTTSVQAGPTPAYAGGGILVTTDSFRRNKSLKLTRPAQKGRSRFGARGHGGTVTHRTGYRQQGPTVGYTPLAKRLHPVQCKHNPLRRLQRRGGGGGMTRGHRNEYAVGVGYR